MNDQENARVRKFLKEATLGLESDPEIRMEVEAELTSHLDAHVEEALGEGQSETEAADSAIAALGSSSEMAMRFIDANRKRMKLRSWVSVMLRRVLVPLSVLLVIGVTFYEARRAVHVSFMGYYYHGGELPTATRLLGVKDPVQEMKERLSEGLSEEDQQFVLNGLEGVSVVAQARELWEKNPQDRVLFANYVSQSLTHEDVLPPQFDQVVQEIDPENGYFSILKLSSVFEAAYQRDGESKSPSRWTVLDQAKLDEGVETFILALKKEKIQSYHRTLLQRQLKKVTSHTDMDLIDSSDRVCLSMNIPTPEILLYKEACDAASLKVYQLGEAGDRDALRKLREAWEEGMPKMAAGSEFLAGNLVTISNGSRLGEELCKAFRNLEMAGEAEEVDSILTRLEQIPKQFWEDYINGSLPLSENEEAQLGLWGAFILPSQFLNQKLDVAKDFKPSRELDYIFRERFSVSLLLVALLLGMVSCAVCVIRWKFAKEDSPSILLLLKLKDYAVILGGGVVLPLLVFYLLSRFTPLGGHEWSASALTYRWIFQLSFLGVLILSLLIQLSRITLRKRLSELGEEEIAVLSLGNAFRIPALAMAGFSLACLVAPLEKPAEPLIAAMSLILFGMLCWFGVRLFRGLVGGKNGRAYSAALTRSLLPVCSGAVLILALGVLPALQRMEEYWVSKDQILDLTGGLSSMEQDASAWLKSEIVAAFSEAEEGSARRR